MADQFNTLDSGDVQALTANLLTSGESTIARENITTLGITLSNQALRLCYFTARKTEPITQVRMTTTGTAAAATPTLIRIGLWTADLAGALLAQVAATANDTTLFAAPNTRYTKAFASSFTKQAGQHYAVGVLVVTGAAAPTTQGGFILAVGADYGDSPRLCGVIAAQADLPASAAAGGIADSTNRIQATLLP